MSKTDTPEGKALWYLLYLLGENGRGRLKPALLDASVDGNEDAKILLDQINIFERALGQLDRMSPDERQALRKYR